MQYIKYSIKKDFPSGDQMDHGNYGTIFFLPTGKNPLLMQLKSMSRVLSVSGRLMVCVSCDPFALTMLTIYSLSIYHQLAPASATDSLKAVASVIMSM